MLSKRGYLTLFLVLSVSFLLIWQYVSSLFPIKMIAILEWTQSNAQQNIEQLQTPTMGVKINSHHRV